jgi:hypothetical protein
LEKPARKIRASKKGSFRGKFNSKKNRRMIYWESLLELDYIKTLEFDPEVTSYKSQPIEIEYWFQGKKRRYFPDFLVTKRTEEIFLVEVKPEDKVEDEENKIKAQVGEMYCKEQDWSYIVVTEKDIRQGYFLENFDFLENYKEEWTNIRGRQYLQKLYLENIPCTIAGLKELALEEMENGEFYAHIYYLIYQQIIRADLINQEINEQMVLG